VLDCLSRSINHQIIPEWQISVVGESAHRDETIVCRRSILQKALFEMNVQLSNVISDASGESGLTHHRSDPGRRTQSRATRCSVYLPD
jgi:hypothetical protein